MTFECRVHFIPSWLIVYLNRSLTWIRPTARSGFLFGSKQTSPLLGHLQWLLETGVPLTQRSSVCTDQSSSKCTEQHPLQSRRRRDNFCSEVNSPVLMDGTLVLTSAARQRDGPASPDRKWRCKCYLSIASFRTCRWVEKKWKRTLRNRLKESATNRIVFIWKGHDSALNRLGWSRTVMTPFFQPDTYTLSLVRLVTSTMSIWKDL